MKTNYNEKYKPAYQIHIIKKDGSKEPFQVQKVVDAVGKSAYRVMVEIGRASCRERVYDLV